MAKFKTKRIKVRQRSRGDAKKLAALQADGWVIQSRENIETMFGRDKGWEFVVLVKAR